MDSILWNLFKLKNWTTSITFDFPKASKRLKPFQLLLLNLKKKPGELSSKFDEIWCELMRFFQRFHWIPKDVMQSLWLSIKSAQLGRAMSLSKASAAERRLIQHCRITTELFLHQQTPVRSADWFSPIIGRDTRCEFPVLTWWTLKCRWANGRMMCREVSQKFWFGGFQ